MRRSIQATVSRKSVLVMVKVTGGGRGMTAIAAQFRDISRAGKLEIEDNRGDVRRGMEALHDLVEQWRHGGVPIDEVGHRGSDCARRRAHAQPERNLLLTRAEALRAWGRIVDALTASALAEDHRLAGEIRGFVKWQPTTQFAAQTQQRQQDIIRTQPPTRQAAR